MSYYTFKSYLEKGNFTVITSYDDFFKQKTDVGLKAKLVFRCESGHEMGLTLSSLKNKKHKFKDSYDGFCPRCTRQCGNSSTTSKETVCAVSVEHNAGCLEESNTHNIVKEEEDIVKEESLTEDNVEIKNFVIPQSNFDISVYKNIEPDFIKYYLEKRPVLYNSYKNVGWLVYDHDPYFDKVEKWFVENINVFTKTRLRKGDLYISDDSCILSQSIPSLRVVTQSVTVYNVDPSTIFSLYKKKYNGHPYMIFLFDDNEILDVWYIIPGKKIYSVTHKYNCNVKDKISAYCTHDENDYHYFEKTMFELEMS